MKAFAEQKEKLARLCADTAVSDGIDALLKGLRDIYPNLEFDRVMTRSGWYRLGGVVDADYKPVTDSIAKWATEESGGDVDKLLDEYMDSGYFVTRLSGKTHYLNASLGDGPEEYVQLEVEELHEVLARPLVDSERHPDTLAEFIDPPHYTRLEAEPVAEPYFLFRRIVSIPHLLSEKAGDSRQATNLKRFFADWRQSSAGRQAPFCRHWIMELREYVGRDGEANMNARPVFAAGNDMPELPGGEALSGAPLAQAIRDYDHKTGYPFSWFFMMLSSRAANFKLADAVLRDQSGDYDYLPARDLEVLQGWEARPYNV